MIRVSKFKFLSTILLTFLLIACTYVFPVPVVSAQLEANTHTKTLDVLNNVLGLNTQIYQITHASLPNNQYNGLPQNETILTLASNQSTLTADCSFINNNLRELYISDYQGTPSFASPISASTVDMAQSFLTRYQLYASDSFYGTLASMLRSTNENVNSSVISGNIKFAVSNFNQKTIDYTWTYVDANGAEAAAKTVILSYHGGQLQFFLNNWPLYTVATDTPKISMTSATAIAINASKCFSYQIEVNGTPQTISGFTVAPASLTGQTLSYLNFPDPSYARGGDPFILYPSWYVPLGFDKFYPGDVTGMTVTVWADIGQVSSMYQTVFGRSAIPQSQSSALSTSSMVTYSVLAAIASCIAVLGFIKKRAVSIALGGRRVLAISLAFLIFMGSMAGLAASSLPKVSATTPNSMIGTSNIFGISNQTVMVQSEVNAATNVTTCIQSLLSSDGYSSNNYYGSATTNSQIYSATGYAEGNFGQVTTFYFGHLYQFYEAFQDNNDHGVYASQIAQHTTGKQFFDWLWVCEQVNTSLTNGLAKGDMPVAWTKNPNLSNNGFDSSDLSNQCFITFTGISPQIGNATGTFNCTAFYNVSPGPLQYFIYKVYNYALNSNYQYTIHNALNQASIDFFGVGYDGCVLNIGYNGAWYPGGMGIPSQYGRGQMFVFGDSNIKLYQPYVTIKAIDSNNNTISTSLTIAGNSFATGSGGYFESNNCFSVSAPTISGYQFQYFNYSGSGYEFDAYTNPASIQLWNDGVLTAVYSAVMYSVTFQANDGNGGGTMSPLGTQYYTLGTNVPIHAYHSEGYVFVRWYTSDNNKASLASTDWPDTYVHMLGSGATVYPVFVPVPTYATTVNAYVTYDGYNYGYYDSIVIYEPEGSNYLSFGSLFVQAYNYYDSSTHYSEPDWYDLGTGTTIDVYYNLSGG